MERRHKNLAKNTFLYFLVFFFKYYSILQLLSDYNDKGKNCTVYYTDIRIIPTYSYHTHFSE